jgi:hypothetical protein
MTYLPQIFDKSDYYYDTGKWEKIGGVDSYVATPAGDYPQNKAILFLTDVFGPQIPNAQVCSSYDLGDVAGLTLVTQIIFFY